MVDGDDDLFVDTRNFVSGSKFNETLAVPYSKRDTPKPEPADILGRRTRISDVHNELKTYIKNCKYVLGLEDDTILHSKSLKYLLDDFLEQPNAGLISGVELGRWGKPYVGAWKADDIYEPRLIESLMPPDDIQMLRDGKYLESLDAGGLYCFMSKKDIYTSHDFKPFQNNGMGPDADYGITLRQLGYSNFVDWRIKCVHLHGEEKISFVTHKPVKVGFRKHPGRRVWQFFSK